MEQFRSHAVTHPGTKRDHNEDMFVDRSDLGLWAVADGAGGHDAGEVASEMIATTLETIPLELTAEEMLAQVRLRISATHTALRECAARKGEGALVASTVVVLIVRHGHFACLWAGDCAPICCATASCSESHAITALCRNWSTPAKSMRPTPRAIRGPIS